MIIYHTQIRQTMQIIQLLDLHIGSLFKQDVFDTIVNEINKLKPDVKVVTGDLTDEGLLSEYERAKLEIEKLDCTDIIVLPGNHDYRHTGYLPFKKYFPTSSTHIYEFEDAVIVTPWNGTPR
jgi:Icc protein